MPLTAACPNCNSRVKAPDRAAGRSVSCPRCKTRFAVGAPAPAADVFDFGADAPAPEEAPRPKRERPRGMTPERMAAIVFLVLVSVALLGGGGYLGWTQYDKHIRAPRIKHQLHLYRWYDQANSDVKNGEWRVADLTRQLASERRKAAKLATADPDKAAEHKAEAEGTAKLLAETERKLRDARESRDDCVRRSQQRYGVHPETFAGLDVD